MRIVTEMRICKMCKKDQPVGNFIREDYPKQKSKKYSPTCSTCRAKRRQQRANLQFYTLLFNTQKGCCAICNRHESQLKLKLAVDHNHKTGIIRGLICHRCNIGLGIYENRQKEFNNYLRTAPQRMIKIYKELLDKQEKEIVNGRGRLKRDDRGKQDES